MKTKQILCIPVFVVFIISIVFTGCEDRILEKYTINEPVYMSYDELRSAVQNVEATELKSPGKIYFKDNYLFINEYFKGIHIIDNSDPSAPVNISFIEIPGNVDIAIKDNILYADSYVDLVSLDISDLSNIYEVSRIEDIFPYTLPTYDNEYLISNVDANLGVVASWNIKEITEEIKNDNPFRYPFYAKFSNMEFAVDFSGSGSQSSTGTGGSMARFTIYDFVLYAINNNRIVIFDISTLTEPTSVGDEYISWNIETLFPYKDKLFIGSQNGMLIYDLVNPLSPTKISSISHVTSCDPVVVEGDYAYVTLRSGNACGGFTDQLDVIDISILSSPQLLRSYTMTEPYGLGIDNSILFICDGKAGLKIYDASDPFTITDNLIVSFPEINTFDVIPYDDVLMMIGLDGLYQYDYQDINNIELLSIIQVVKE